jgi:NADPH:quinone reductase-like Zn-dependent oxidoreductase
MESYRALAPCGRLICFGFSSAAVGPRSGTLSALRTLARVPWWQLNPIRLMNDNKSLAGVNLGRMWGRTERLGAWLNTLLVLLGTGEISPLIDGVFPFAEAAAAHRRLEERLNVGKVLLTPDKVDWP